MEEERDLPANVVDALRRGHKIEAIKLLREAEGLDLKAAKERVERHAVNHPGSTPTHRANSFNFVPLVVAAVIAALTYYLSR